MPDGIERQPRSTERVSDTTEDFVPRREARDEIPPDALPKKQPDQGALHEGGPLPRATSADIEARALTLLRLTRDTPAFSPTRRLEDARASLERIPDKKDRSTALARFARAEIAAGYRHDVLKTIEKIEDPRQRLILVFEQYEVCLSEGSRVWDPGELLQWAEKAAGEIDDPAYAAEANRKLALIAWKTSSQASKTFAAAIQDPELRAQTLMTLWRDSLAAQRGEAREFLELARLAIAEVADAERRPQLLGQLRAISQQMGSRASVI
jgi:hypothetical protein